MSTEGYPADWNSRRKEVYQRDDYTCQNCGVKGGSKGNAELHAHHIVPKSKGGTHKKSNLKTICKECHNAIHGDSMARSVNDVEQNTSLDFPVEIDNYPYTISEYIECLNTIAGIQDGFNEFWEISGDLVEYASTCQELDGDVPERVEHRYEDTRGDVTSALDEVQDNIKKLRDIDKSGFDSPTEKELCSFITVAADLLDDAQEYVQLVHDMATTNRFSESDYYNLQILKEDIADTDISNAITSVSNQLNKGLDEKLSEMGEMKFIGGMLSEPMEICSICGSSMNQEKYSKSGNGTDFILLSCDDCEAEWASQGYTYAITNNSDGIERISLAPTVWNKIREDNKIISKNLDHYREMSDKLVKYKHYSFITIMSALAVTMLYLISQGSWLILGLTGPVFGTIQVLIVKLLRVVIVK